MAAVNANGSKCFLLDQKVYLPAALREAQRAGI